MAIITVVKAIKSIHVDSIILIKVGKFYHVYGRDSYILSYLFGYSLKQNQGISFCGFPVESINKIMAKLEQRKINFLTVDRRNNYDVEQIIDNKNLNTYNVVYKKAKEYINSKQRVSKIYNYMMQHLNDKELIQRMEKVIIDEGRKV